jgi:hypothetical protein
VVEVIVVPMLRIVIKLALIDMKRIKALFNTVEHHESRV